MPVKLPTDYLKLLNSYLEKPSKGKYNALDKGAFDPDSIPAKYYSQREDSRISLKDKTDKLLKKDKREWARLLTSIYDSEYSHYGGSIYSDLKAKSPFAGKTLLFIDYGSGFVKMDLENLHGLAGKKLRKDNYKTYDCDDYVLALPGDKSLEKLIDKAEIIWTRCGILGMDVPRDSEGKRK